MTLYASSISVKMRIFNQMCKTLTTGDNYVLANIFIARYYLYTSLHASYFIFCQLSLSNSALTYTCLNCILLSILALLLLLTLVFTLREPSFFLGFLATFICFCVIVFFIVIADILRRKRKIKEQNKGHVIYTV